MSPMTKNTQLICVCYQDLPYILLRHVFLSLSGPITALPGKINKGHMRSSMKNTWQRQLSLVKEKKKIRSQVHLSHVTCFNVFISSLVSNKSAGREQQNVVCTRMMCQNWNDNRNHVTALPEMTFHYISMTHCLYYNNVTWPAWQKLNQPKDKEFSLESSCGCC